MPGFEIVTIDVRDDSALAEWYAVEMASAHHERPFALQRSLTALAASVRHPNDRQRRVLLAARHDGEIVGVADLVLGTVEILSEAQRVD